MTRDEDSNTSLVPMQPQTNADLQGWLRHPLATWKSQRNRSLAKQEQSGVAHEVILTSLAMPLTSFIRNEIEESQLQRQIRRKDIELDGHLPDDTQLLRSFQQNIESLSLQLTVQDKRTLSDRIDVALDILANWRHLHRNVFFHTDREAPNDKARYTAKAREILTGHPYSDESLAGFGIDDPVSTTMLAAILYTYAHPDRQVGRHDDITPIITTLRKAIEIFQPETTTDFQVILIDCLLHNFTINTHMVDRLLLLRANIRKPDQSLSERRHIAGLSNNDD